MARYPRRGGGRPPGHRRRSRQDRDDAALDPQYGVDEEVTGVYQAAPRRGGYLVPDRAGIPDVRIPPTYGGAALHGDQVRVRIYRAKPGRQARGQVVEILRHANKQLLGRLVRASDHCVVTPKNARIDRNVVLPRRIPPDQAPDGAWVMVEIRHWSESPSEPLIGRLIEVVGEDGDPGLPILLLIREGGVAIEFGDEVEREAATIELREGPGTAAFAEEVERRRDLRGERILTIDPATAKDFDDAVHLVEAGEDGWRIGVHIADVAHYVRPGTALDDEGFDRATSIYPVDRVIPMLPETLSNNLCSLRPDEDKLAMSVEFTVTREGRIRDFTFANSVIRSVRRFAYEQVQGLFDAIDEAAGVDYPKPKQPRPRPGVAAELIEDLKAIRAAARALNEARMRRGALDLDMPETQVVFGEDGDVVDIVRRERFEAHRLIEELMLAANEAVARELERRGFPLLYRVHDEPDSAGLEKIVPVLRRLGLEVAGRGIQNREALQAVLDAAHRHRAAHVIQRFILRAMMKAKYQPDNIGHYGLASDCYCHFTSPIRRYPDLVVHRVLKRMLAAETPSEDERGEPAEALALKGRHCSMREERAQRIEWDAIEILSMQFMRRHLGDVFDGYVVGVAPMGLFVELGDYPVEGLVHIGGLDDDYYDLDEARMEWIGRGSGRTYGVGQPVTVLVDRVDVLAGRMDLILLQKGGRRRAR